jgi:Protein of unknown function (DUF2924)
MRRPVDVAQVEAEIARLRDLDLAALRVEWRKLMRSEPPAFMKRDLLLRGLAYQLQVRAFGGLDRDSTRLLDRLARADNPGAVLASMRQRRLKPGTLLVREWGGEIHRVIVAEHGFLWREQTYESLSVIARMITGTRWNGPRFFGLREHRAGERKEAGQNGPSLVRRRGRPRTADRSREPADLEENAGSAERRGKAGLDSGGRHHDPRCSGHEGERPLAAFPDQQPS